MHVAWVRPRWDWDIAPDTSEERRWGLVLWPKEFCQHDGFQLVAQADPKNALPLSLFMNYPSLNRTAGAFCSLFVEYGWLSKSLFSIIEHTQQWNTEPFSVVVNDAVSGSLSSFTKAILGESSHSNTPKVVFNQWDPRLRWFWAIWFLFELKRVYSPQNKRMPTTQRSLTLLHHQPESSWALRNSTG